MEWERKFYDIVRETETNLANARRKLREHDTSKHSSAQLESFSPSYQPSTSTSYVNNNDHINFIRRQMGWSLPTTPDGMMTPTLSSPFSNQLKELQIKMDSQSQTIENLEQLVKTLNQEKEQYQRQIKDLRDKVGDLSGRLVDMGSVDPVLKSQVDQMRQEVRLDLRRLEDVVSTSRPSDKLTNTLERHFRDMQKNINTELEELRRDLNKMIHRVGKLELNVSTHTTSHRDLHSRVSESAARTGSLDHLRYSLYHPRHSDSALTPGNMYQVTELRNTVSHLRDKLDNLEGRVATSKPSPRSRSLPHAHKFPKASSSFKSSVQVIMEDAGDEDKDEDVDDDNNNSDLDDLDLSEELDDLELPLSYKGLSDEVDEILNVATMLQGKAETTALNGTLDDDSLSDLNDDETDDFGSRRTGQGSGLSQRRMKKEERTHTLLSTLAPMKGALLNPDLLDLDRLDLDTSDPFDLDSLDDISDELKTDDL